MAKSMLNGNYYENYGNQIEPILLVEQSERNGYGQIFVRFCHKEYREDGSTRLEFYSDYPETTILSGLQFSCQYNLQSGDIEVRKPYAYRLEYHDGIEFSLETHTRCAIKTKFLARVAKKIEKYESEYGFYLGDNITFGTYVQTIARIIGVKIIGVRKNEHSMGIQYDDKYEEIQKTIDALIDG